MNRLASVQEVSQEFSMSFTKEMSIDLEEQRFGCGSLESEDRSRNGNESSSSSSVQRNDDSAASKPRWSRSRAFSYGIAVLFGVAASSITYALLRRAEWDKYQQDYEQTSKILASQVRQEMSYLIQHFQSLAQSISASVDYSELYQWPFVTIPKFDETFSNVDTVEVLYSPVVSLSQKEEWKSYTAVTLGKAIPVHAFHKNRLGNQQQKQRLVPVWQYSAIDDGNLINLDLSTVDAIEKELLISVESQKPFFSGMLVGTDLSGLLPNTDEPFIILFTPIIQSDIRGALTVALLSFVLSIKSLVSVLEGDSTSHMDVVIGDECSEVHATFRVHNGQALFHGYNLGHSGNMYQYSLSPGNPKCELTLKVRPTSSFRVTAAPITISLFMASVFAAFILILVTMDRLQTASSERRKKQRIEPRQASCGAGENANENLDSQGSSDSANERVSDDEAYRVSENPKPPVVPPMTGVTPPQNRSLALSGVSNARIDPERLACSDLAALPETINPESDHSKRGWLPQSILRSVSTHASVISAMTESSSGVTSTTSRPSSTDHSLSEGSNTRESIETHNIEKQTSARTKTTPLAMKSLGSMSLERYQDSLLLAHSHHNRAAEQVVYSRPILKRAYSLESLAQNSLSTSMHSIQIIPTTPLGYTKERVTSMQSPSSRSAWMHSMSSVTTNFSEYSSSPLTNVLRVLKNHGSQRQPERSIGAADDTTATSDREAWEDSLVLASGQRASRLASKKNTVSFADAEDDPANWVETAPSNNHNITKDDDDDGYVQGGDVMEAAWQDSLILGRRLLVNHTNAANCEDTNRSNITNDTFTSDREAWEDSLVLGRRTATQRNNDHTVAGSDICDIAHQEQDSNQSKKLLSNSIGISNHSIGAYNNNKSMSSLGSMSADSFSDHSLIPPEQRNHMFLRAGLMASVTDFGESAHSFAI